METHIGMGWGMVEQGGWRKGPWTAEEDRLLIDYVKVHGEGRWNSVARLVGLKRNGKSCRLRWVNYLRPDLKKGQITPYEESIIIELHARWGNRWSTIARSLPGRTDNEIKNYWRTHFKKKTKGYPNDIEKSKTRLLRKQLFQQQQQQYRYELQQQQELLQNQHQFTLFDLKKMVSLLGDNENEVATIIPQAKEEVTYASMCPTNEGQGAFYTMFDNNDTSTSQSSNEDLLWDGIWGMDDVQGNNWSAICTTNKVGMHNFVAPLC